MGMNMGMRGKDLGKFLMVAAYSLDKRLGAGL